MSDCIPTQTWVDQVYGSDVTVLTQAHRTTINLKDYEWRTEVICGNEVFSVDCWKQNEDLAKRGHDFMVGRVKMFIDAAKRQPQDDDRNGLRVLVYQTKPSEPINIVAYEKLGFGVFNSAAVDKVKPE